MTAIGAANAISPAPETAGDVLCPMCDYNLHGLAEPRCPECGFAFEWRDLTDPTRRKHKYLFEQHPERNAWSFTRTALGGLRPWRFWRSLRPEQPSNLRRLVVYWLVTACGFLVLPLAIFAVSCVAANKENLAMRRMLALRAADPLFIRTVAEAHGSLQAFLDMAAPLPPSRAFFGHALQRVRERSGFDAVIAVALCLIVLPWAVALALMLFQATMRRARVRGSHVLRCCLYSFDNGWWLGVLLAGLFGGVALDLAPRGTLAWLSGVLPQVVLVFTAAALLFGTGKLLFAYRMYMRFPHASATVILALLVSALALATAIVNLPGMETPLMKLWRAL